MVSLILFNFNYHLTVHYHLASVLWADYDNKIIIGTIMGGINPFTTKIAAFDFDFTLVCTKTEKNFPIDQHDWKLFDSHLPKYLKQLIKKGYSIVIFSNQLGVSKGKTDLNMIKNRFNEVLQALSIPCTILLAIQDDIYRKPMIGLWHYFLQNIHNPAVKVDMSSSFYVGDAAGRKKTLMKKADHSSCDIMFALNCKLKFLLPEEFCQYMKNNIKFKPNTSISDKCFQFKFNADEYKSLLTNRITKKHFSHLSSVLPSEPHCIIFVGISGSGKTTFYHNYFQSMPNYVHINMDKLKTKQACVSLLKNSMKERKNCIVDNTNLDKKSRMEWIDLCKKNQYRSLIFYFDLPLIHIFHNNKFRHVTKLNQSVPDVVIYSQNKKFETLTDEECSEQYTVNFVPKFAKNEDREIYGLYLVEK